MPPLSTPGLWHTQQIGGSDGDEDDVEEAPRARYSLKRSLISETEHAEEEDELAVALPLRSAKRARLTGRRPGKLRVDAVRMVNGTMTPITGTEATCTWSRTSTSDTDFIGRRTVQRQSALSSSSVITIDSDDESVLTPMRYWGGRSWREVSATEADYARKKTLLVSSIGPAYPRWMYQGAQAPAQNSPERSAVAALLGAYRRQYPTSELRPEWTSFQLDDFNIYQPPHSAWHAGELVTLEKLTQPRKGEFYLSGVLSCGLAKYFVKDVSFNILTVEYGDTRPWLDRVCVQSGIAMSQDIYYTLGRPAPEYKRFYEPFLSVAQFTDYFVDFAYAHDNVTIANFRSDFWVWLQRTHGEDVSFRTWHRHVKLQDFRCLVAINVEFLWKECWNLDQQSAGTAEATRLRRHPVWAEVHPERLRAIRAQPTNVHANTVVTPFAYRSFQSMYFAGMLGVHTIADKLRDRVAERKRSLGLTPLHCVEHEVVATRKSISPLKSIADVYEGDVVVLNADRSGDWKLSTSDLWYAYVQRVWTDRKRSKRLDVIWLYQPSDTTIGNAPYAYSNELFLSDNCGCGEEALYLDRVKDIVGKVRVSWHASDPSIEDVLFVRRTFRTVPELNQYDFVQLQDQHFCCHHQEGHIGATHVEFQVGDTVLVYKTQDTTGRNCRPAVIVGFCEGGDVRLRKLVFASQVLPGSRARPNELIFTSEECVRHEDAIVRRCHIRLYERGQIRTGNVPTPYDRDGAGDYFYIAKKQDRRQPEQVAILNQGWDPQSSDGCSKLKGLGLFSGGGTFDRGLAEGGAVQFSHVVDLAEKALHSYRANDRYPEQTQYFLGSVNEFLTSALAGKNCKVVANFGCIDLIAAGAPCQAFSKMQRHKQSEQSLRNASMVASVVAFVDAYAPRYLILENVVGMTQKLEDGQNVFSHIIAALVGLGYQVQQFLMDAYYYGSSQARSRVFIIATAPICTILKQPEYTHARTAHLERQRNLGKCTNGKPYGSRRENAFVAFAPCTAEESVRDLPDIQDGQPCLCPPAPDHRPAREETEITRNRIAVVPKRPRGMTLVQAVQAGLVRGEPLDYCRGSNQIKVGPSSAAYQRVVPDHTFPTIITRLAVGDGMNGQVVHWDQDRVLTIMEARRAQGYPDDEVLVGLPTDRMKIVGNSVDRKVALALGLALRDSWLKSPQVAHNSLDHESGLDPADGMPTTAPDVAEIDAFRSGISASATAMPKQDGGDLAPASDTPDDSVSSVDSSPLDNRTVKMSLSLSQADIAASRMGEFKRINALLDRPEHRAARQSLHGLEDESSETDSG